MTQYRVFVACDTCRTKLIEGSVDADAFADVLADKVAPLVREHRCPVLGKMYAIGRFSGEDFSGINGPTPSLGLLLDDEGETSDDYIVELGGDVGPDRRLYRWLGGAWELVGRGAIRRKGGPR